MSLTKGERMGLGEGEDKALMGENGWREEKDVELHVESTRA